MAIIASQAGEDYIHWQCVDRALVKRINRFIDDALRDPTASSASPSSSNAASLGLPRRITEEHRLVHQVMGEDLMILQTGSPSRQLPR